MSRKQRMSVHYTDRGGGYNMPLLYRRIVTREAEVVVIGAEPARKQWSGLVTATAADLARLAKGGAMDLAAGGTEYAYRQHTDVWTAERRELVSEGAAAPMVVEYGYYTQYVAFYWSSQPNAQGAVNESRIRSANRDMEAAGLAPKLVEPVPLPALEAATREDEEALDVPGA